MKKVSIVGLGYIGLPTAVLAAEVGYDVYGYDIDENKVKAISAGDAPIEEPGLQERLSHVIKKKKLVVATKLQPAHFIVIAVPTPFKQGKKADLKHVYAAAKTIGQSLEPKTVVIIESTIPVGVSEKIARRLEKYSGLKASKDFFVAHCPERILPGKAFYELVHNDRIIGGICYRSARQACEFYARFVKGELYVCDDKTAEMVKLVENASRDVQIAFANQVAAMARKAKINPFEVIELANRHPRVTMLQPGCGVGGHCIAVDPWFLVEGFSAESALLKQARVVNDAKPGEVAKEIISLLPKKGATIALLGITFKPDIDDLRSSPALEVAQELTRKKQEVIVCEPNVSDTIIRSLSLKPATMEQALQRADVVALLVKHTVFRSIPLKRLEEKKVIDTCGLLYELRKLKRPRTFHAARTMNEEEKRASLIGIKKRNIKKGLL